MTNRHVQTVTFTVHPPKPIFFLKTPFRELDDSKTPYAVKLLNMKTISLTYMQLGFNAGDVIFLQSKRIMRAKAKVQDFHLEPGATIHAVKTITVTIEEISPKVSTQR